MDAGLFIGVLLLVVCLAGCGASAINVAINTANSARDVAIAAHKEIQDLCVLAEQKADTIDKANTVIETCSDAENAYGVFRSAWLAAAAAIRTAQLSGTAPDNLAELVAEVGKAAAALEDAVARIKVLAQ